MRKLILLLAILLSNTVLAERDLIYHPEAFPIFEGKKIVRNGLWDSPPPQFEELKRAYEEGHFTNYEEFIQYLLKQGPGLKQRNILIHHSESQQMSSFEWPRVILYQGSTFYGLSDHPDQRDRRVEILQGKENSYDVEMREIIFKKDNVEFRSNPKSCVLCHGSPAKPLWASYDHWKASTYGDAGAFGKSENHYRQLLTNAGSMPSIRNLDLPVAHNSDDINSWADQERSDRVWGLDSAVKQLFFRNWFGHNLRLDRLSYGDGLRIIVALACNNADQEQLRDAKIYKSEFIAANVARQKHMRSLMLQRLDVPHARFGNPDVDRNFEFYERDFALMSSLWLFGIPTASFSSDLGFSVHLTKAIGNNIDNMLVSFYQVRPDLFKNIQWVPKGLTFKNEQLSLIQVDCSSLKDELKKYPYKKSAKPFVPSYRRVDRDLPVLTRCMQCHVTHISDTQNKAPEIPFNDASALATLLRAPGNKLKASILERVSSHGPDQMPPGSGLTKEETAAMKEYLEQLE